MVLKVVSNYFDVLGSLVYEGTWNAATNNPTLTSGVGTKGYYYVVNVPGNTNLDGNTNWQVGDWAVFNGTVWQQVQATSRVTSVNGYTGAVVLGATDVGATPNTTYVLAGTALSGGGRLTGNVTLNLANTTVTAGTYGSSSNTAQITVDAQGRITSASNVAIPQGTVTNIATGTGLTGGPITSTGTISLANTAVTPASYTYASITVDQQGRLTAASNGTAPVTSVAGTAPISSSGGTTPSISISQAGASSNGYLSSTDWNTFNNKQPAGSYVTSVSGTSGQITSTGGTTPTLALATTTVPAASYGAANTVASFTVDSYGRLTAASNVTIAVAVSQVSGAVPNTRNINTGTGLSGGGSLAADLTLSVTANTTNQKVTVANNGVVTASEPAINFVPGSNVTITTADDAANSRVNVTVALSAGTLGTMASQNANSVSITGGTVNATHNFLNGTAASATMNTSIMLAPAGYLNIALANATVVKIPFYAA